MQRLSTLLKKSLACGAGCRTVSRGAGRPLLLAWGEAIAHRQPDVLRALLLLSDEGDIRRTRAHPQYDSPLHRALPLADAGLAEIIKQYPNETTHHTRNKARDIGMFARHELAHYVAQSSGRQRAER